MPVLSPVTDPAMVPDTYVSGLHSVEDIGDGNYRFTFYTRQKSVFGQGEELMVVARMILPTSAIVFTINATLTAIGAHCCGDGFRALVH